MRINIDQITVYQSLFINKANVNRGSRNGMTYSRPDNIFFHKYHKFSIQSYIKCGYLLEEPRRGDSNRSPQHMTLWRNYHLLSF